MQEFFYSETAMDIRPDNIQNLCMQETWRDRAKRAMRGRINQETLAERLGTSQPGLSHWLNARSQPSLDDINRIADEIGVSRVWLTHGLGFEAGPGKLLLDLLMSATWSDEQLQPLALTAQALLKASPHNAMETADFAGKPKALAATPKSIAAKVPRA